MGSSFYFSLKNPSFSSAPDIKYTNITCSDIEWTHPHSRSIPSTDWTKSKRGGEDKVLFVFQVSLMELEFGISLDQPLSEVTGHYWLLAAQTLTNPDGPRPIISQLTLRITVVLQHLIFGVSCTLTHWPQHVFQLALVTTLLRQRNWVIENCAFTMEIKILFSAQN